MQVVKAGEGRLWGVSNAHEQPGKTLVLYDGDIVLCHLTLESAFPPKPVILGGVEYIEPGIVLNILFCTHLGIETDGEVELDYV